MGLVFPLALLTSLKLAMHTTPYLPAASAAQTSPSSSLSDFFNRQQKKQNRYFTNNRGPWSEDAVLAAGGQWPPSSSLSFRDKMRLDNDLAPAAYDDEGEMAERYIQPRADPYMMNPRQIISALRPSGTFVMREPSFTEDTALPESSGLSSSAGLITGSSNRYYKRRHYISKKSSASVAEDGGGEREVEEDPVSDPKKREADPASGPNESSNYYGNLISRLQTRRDDGSRRHYISIRKDSRRPYISKRGRVYISKKGGRRLYISKKGGGRRLYISKKADGGRRLYISKRGRPYVSKKDSGSDGGRRLYISKRGRRPYVSKRGRLYVSKREDDGGGEEDNDDMNIELPKYLSIRRHENMDNEASPDDYYDGNENENMKLFPVDV